MTGLAVCVCLCVWTGGEVHRTSEQKAPAQTVYSAKRPLIEEVCYQLSARGKHAQVVSIWRLQGCTTHVYGGSTFPGSATQQTCMPLGRIKPLHVSS